MLGDRQVTGQAAWPIAQMTSTSSSVARLTEMLIAG
jgi:hypothetical protein